MICSGMKHKEETTMENNNKSKGINLLQKLYRYRLKIDRNGTPIVNLSSLFCLASLIFAPHVTIAGLIISLILGYHINLDSEGDAKDLEQSFSGAAEAVKKMASTAVNGLREGIDKIRTESAADAGKQQEAQAAPAAAPAVAPAAAPAPADIPVNQEIVEDLRQHMEPDFFQGNSAFHTAYSASAGSVPTLQVHEEAPAAEENPSSRTDYQR